MKKIFFGLLYTLLTFNAYGEGITENGTSCTAKEGPFPCYVEEERNRASNELLERLTCSVQRTDDLNKKIEYKLFDTVEKARTIYTEAKSPGSQTWLQNAYLGTTIDDIRMYLSFLIDNDEYDNFGFTARGENSNFFLSIDVFDDHLIPDQDNINHYEEMSRLQLHVQKSLQDRTSIAYFGVDNYDVSYDVRCTLSEPLKE